jgi:hypothetical protein
MPRELTPDEALEIIESRRLIKALKDRLQAVETILGGHGDLINYLNRSTNNLIERVTELENQK